VGVISSGFARGLEKVVVVGVCWRTAESNWALEKVELELSVESVGNAEVGVKVEVGLELKVVEDWTTEEDERVDWTEEGVIDGALDVGVGDTEGEVAETDVGEVNASVVVGPEVGKTEPEPPSLSPRLPLLLPVVVGLEGGGTASSPPALSLPFPLLCRAKRTWRARLP
jgi:hypothetical protein